MPVVGGYDINQSMRAAHCSCMANGHGAVIYAMFLNAAMCVYLKLLCRVWFGHSSGVEPKGCWWHCVRLFVALPNPSVCSSESQRQLPSMSMYLWSLFSCLFPYLSSIFHTKKWKKIQFPFTLQGLFIWLYNKQQVRKNLEKHHLTKNYMIIVSIASL